MYENNSTTNAILVILLVIVVGFIVWFVIGRNGADTDTDVNLPNVEVNLPGGNGGTDTGGTQ